MADRRHHGEGEHHQGNVAMPSMPGSALVVIEPELVFRGLKAVLDRPAMAFDRHQHFDRCSHWTPSGEEGEIAIGDVATDQQTARPQTLIFVLDSSTSGRRGPVSAPVLEKLLLQYQHSTQRLPAGLRFKAAYRILPQRLM